VEISVFSIRLDVSEMHDKRADKRPLDYAAFRPPHGRVCTSGAIFVSAGDMSFINAQVRRDDGVFALSSFLGTRHQINEINQINETQQTCQTNEINQTNQSTRSAASAE
jgi:hypothetical protein